MERCSCGDTQAVVREGGEPGVQEEDQTQTQQSRRQMDEDLRGIILPHFSIIQQHNVYTHWVLKVRLKGLVRVHLLKGKVSDKSDAQKDGGNSTTKICDKG